MLIIVIIVGRDRFCCLWPSFDFVFVVLVCLFLSEKVSLVVVTEVSVEYEVPLVVVALGFKLKIMNENVCLYDIKYHKYWPICS